MNNLARPLLVSTTFDDADKPEEVLLNEACMTMRVVPSPQFVALMERCRFVQRGRFTWAVGLRDNNARIARFVRLYYRDFVPNSMISIMPYAHPNNLTNGNCLHRGIANPFSVGYRLDAALREQDDYAAIPAEFSAQGLADYGKYIHALHGDRLNPESEVGQLAMKYSSIGGVSVEVKNDVFWVRVFPHAEFAEKYADVIDMRTLKNVRRSHPKPVMPREVKRTLDEIAQTHSDFFEPLAEKIDALLDLSEEVVSVGYLPNKPAAVVIHRGHHARVPTGSSLAAVKRNTDKEVSLSTALRLQEQNPKIKFFIHPGLNDLVNMTRAQSYNGEPRLRDYQKTAVGLHLSTSIGYLQSCSPGLGKGHPLTTKVLTPGGWKQVGDLKVGDGIFGSDGKPTSVTGVFPRGKLDVFKVSFNDGTSVLVDGDHLWAVQTKQGLSRAVRSDDTAAQRQISVSQRKKIVDLISSGRTRHSVAKDMGISPAVTSLWWKRYQEQGYDGLRNIRAHHQYKVMETKELAKKVTFPDGTPIWRIPLVEPVEYSPTAPLPIPAYTLGLILGDGGIAYEAVEVTSEDSDVENLLLQDLRTVPTMTVRKKMYSEKAPQYALVSEPHNAPNPIKNALRDLKLMGTHPHTKFVPEQYLRASIEDRIALFQGLMDTDGYFSKNDHHLQWGSTSQALMEAMAELVESFGGTVRRSTQTKYYPTLEGKKKGKLYYSLAVALPATITPFRLTRKLDGYVPRVRNISRIITSIEPAGREEVRCISVAAENRLYVTEHHIVTHNTVIQLSAMRARSAQHTPYRGLVVCEANVREQWAEEAAKWFPEAQVITVLSHKDNSKLADALGSDKPVVALLSYAHVLLAQEEKVARIARAEHLETLSFEDRMEELMNTPENDDLGIGSLLLDGYWHDICSDESVAVRNGTSKQNEAMWTLRANSGVATALTATPINRTPDDIGRLISWVRNDKSMFSGVPLSAQYDTTNEKDAKELFSVFGPLVFRRDTSEISEELPDISAEVMLLEPTPAEKALSDAAERELKRCYLELFAAVEAMDAARADDDDDRAEYERVKEELAAARGAWLGGTQLARMVNSDPTALLGSESVGAALLMGQGLVAQALTSEPTKRAYFVSSVTARVAAGQQIVAFTEFSTVADLLVAKLQEQGINAQAYTGKNLTARNRHRVAFQRGEVDVLVCTRAGERGLTLNRAAAIYHYDLPWTSEHIIQRTGRGRRIGSQHSVMDVVFLVMKGTIEERIAQAVVSGSVSSSLILDRSRGVDITKTETVLAMGGLMTSFANRNIGNFREFGKLLMGEEASELVVA